MTIRLGLMGFGRIGRSVFRALQGREDFQVVAISDIANHKNLEYLLRYDSQLGRLPHAVSVKEQGDGRSVLTCNARDVQMYSGRNPGDVDWAASKVDYVIQASGGQPASGVRKHLTAGARRVLLCGPADEAPDTTILAGVNCDTLKSSDAVISCGTPTAAAAAPLIKIVEQAFGIERMFLNTVHAYTNTQRLADVPATPATLGRAAAENVVPTASGAAEVLTTIMPHLANKLSGMGLRVPVANGSMLDMTFFTEKPVTTDSVNQAVAAAAKQSYANMVEFVTDPIVSSDVMQSSHSCTFDSLATATLGDRLVKTVAWFDSSSGYVRRVIELMQQLQKVEG